jgi:hypothetical protein
MEAVNMPKVVQQPIQKENASANSEFFGSGSSPFSLQTVKNGNDLSYRLVRNPESQYVSDLDEHFSTNYSMTNFGTLRDSSETITFDYDFSKSIIEDLAFDEELDDSFFYGIQVIEHQPKVIFSQKVELKLNELEKWRPQITIDSFLLDDDE